MHHDAQSPRNRAFGVLGDQDMTAMKEGESDGDVLALALEDIADFRGYAGDLGKAATTCPRTGSGSPEGGRSPRVGSLHSRGAEPT